MKRTAAVIAITVGLFAPLTNADDLYPPAWRFAERSTYQKWEFSNDNYDRNNDNWPADEHWPITMPAPRLKDNGLGFWEPTYALRSGVYREIGGLGLTALIENFPDNSANTYKLINIQIVYHFSELLGTVEVVTPQGATGGLVHEEVLATPGWLYAQYQFRLEPNPDSEEILIPPFDPFEGHDRMIIDQIIIDTICVPEPATFALLGLASLGVIRRRCTRTARG